MSTHPAVRSCRYCPMCHHADLTMTLERRETYSARGRGLLRFAIEQGRAQWNAHVADVMYRFFADGLCRHVCAGHIPHDEMVIDARHQLVSRGEAPAAVAQVKANVARTGNPWGAPEPDLPALTNARRQADVLVYFGPAARVQRPSVVKALTRLLNAADTSFSVLAEEGDPGLLLYQLGDWDAGMASAKSLVEKIVRSGATTLVTPDADAFRVFKTGVGEVPALAGVRVLHSSEWLCQIVGRLSFNKVRASRVAYHDPCALARFAPCMEAPRTLLRTLCEHAPVEIGLWSRDLASCSGECGGVPFTQPDLAKKAAARRVGEARAADASLIVAGSPAAAAMLEGGELPVLELCEFLSQWLE